MRIHDDAVVEIDYTVTGDDGQVIDSSGGGEPVAYLHGHGQIVPGLSSALEGKSSGDSVQVTVDPGDGYGERQENRVMRVPSDDLPEGLEPEVGMSLATQLPSGDVFPVWITEVSEATVTLDANHPLAGKTLHFDVTVKDVRAATQEELQHGHVHGPGGHEH